MLEDIGIRNLATNTQSTYLQQISAFAKHFGRSPEELGPEDIRAWQVHLLEVKKLAPQTIGLAAVALRFLYKITLKREWAVEEIPLPKQPLKLPVILSREEVIHFLECIGSLKHRTILMVAYAGGLRITEATRLKVSDIDSQRMVLRRSGQRTKRPLCNALAPSVGNLTRLVESRTPRDMAISRRHTGSANW